MKIFVDPPYGLSKAMSRVSLALKTFAPAGHHEVKQEADADLVVLHIIGWTGLEDAVARLQARHQRFVIAQYCLRTTERKHVGAWLDVWKQAEMVWSYYDLMGMARADGVEPPTNVYCSPLGVNATVFTHHPEASDRKHFVAMMSGYVAWSECLNEVAEAAGERPVFHLGPPLPFGPHVQSMNEIPDESLAGYYRNSQFVTGLRREEGFELPALEGLLCGARPILFDQPHYSNWFGSLAEYIPESTPESVVTSLTALFDKGPRKVTDDELEFVRAHFQWRHVAEKFWEQLA
jgi:hypothetical protein